MRSLRFFATLALALSASLAWGHGFPLTLNTDGQGNPVSISNSSNQPILDQDGTAPPVGSSMNTDLFLDQFLGTGTDSRGDYQQTDEGGPRFDSGTWPAGTTITFDVTSPLYFSDGGNAVPASGSTNIYFSDAADSNPNGSGLHADVTGSSAPPVAGFQLLAPFGTIIEPGHEIIKNLYVDPASTQTDGEYGYAFTVSAHFLDGQTLTTGTLVDIFALTGNGSGLSGFLASDALQDAATTSIYNTLVPVPEPSSIMLLGLGAAGLFAAAHRRRRRSRLQRE